MNNSSITLLQKDIQALQNYLDWRTDQEALAILHMEHMEYDLAMSILKDMDKVSLEDFL